MTHDFTIALIAALSSSGTMSLIMYLIQRHDKKKDRQDANKSAQTLMLLGLGHDRIIDLTDKYVRRGGITLKEKRNLNFLYEPYKNLDGNGDCKIGYDACQKLPVISEEEALEMDSDRHRKELGIEVE